MLIPSTPTSGAVELFENLTFIGVCIRTGIGKITVMELSIATRIPVSSFRGPPPPQNKAPVGVRVHSIKYATWEMSQRSLWSSHSRPCSCHPSPHLSLSMVVIKVPTACRHAVASRHVGILPRRVLLGTVGLRQVGLGLLPWIVGSAADGHPVSLGISRISGLAHGWSASRRRPFPLQPSSRHGASVYQTFRPYCHLTRGAFSLAA